MEYKYKLEKYHGPSSKHTCPKCGRNKCFVYYVDANNQIIDTSVGICDHIKSCGYHLPPKEYFAINGNKPNYRLATSNEFKRQENSSLIHSNETKIDYIQLNVVYMTAEREHNFRTYMLLHYPQKEVNNALVKYYVTGTKDYKTIFWQMDYTSNIRSGKIIPYNQESGHRIKDNENIPPVQWVHSMLMRNITDKQELGKYIIKNNKIDEKFSLKQCLFGEHLLCLGKLSEKKIIVVESEKTALIMSMMDNENTYIATGSEENLTVNMFRCFIPLGIKNAVLIPDKGCFRSWQEKAWKINEKLSIDLTCSDFVEKMSLLKDGEDIADISEKLK